MSYSPFLSTKTPPSFLRWLLLCTFISLLCACENGCKEHPHVDFSTLTAPPSSPALLSKGKRRYIELCASCHGTTGHGDGSAANALYIKPTNFSSGVFRYGSSPKQIFKIITEGSPKSPLMVSWRHLPNTDRWALAHFVRTFSKINTKTPKK